jgi:hypothetical protein
MTAASAHGRRSYTTTRDTITLNKGFMASEAPVLTVATAIAALCDELSLAHRAAHLPVTGPVDTEPALACST